MASWRCSQESRVKRTSLQLHLPSGKEDACSSAAHSRTLQSSSVHLAILALLLRLCVIVGADEPRRMERTVVAPDGRGFVTAMTRLPFRPWGLSYGNSGRLMEDFWHEDWETFASDFREM